MWVKRKKLIIKTKNCPRWDALFFVQHKCGDEKYD